MSDSGERPASQQRPPSGTAAAARNVYETHRDDLNRLLEEVRGGETERARRLLPIVSDLARAVGRMVDEEGKLDGARRGRDRAGSGADLSEPPLDLEAARDEVCRRLARLRAAG